MSWSLEGSDHDSSRNEEVIEYPDQESATEQSDLSNIDEESIAPNSKKKELLSELQDAIVQDKLYWVRNDAKIRNVATAKSYDEFRDNVAAAHLTPVQKHDITKRGNICWNMVAHSNNNKIE